MSNLSLQPVGPINSGEDVFLLAYLDGAYAVAVSDPSRAGATSFFPYLDQSGNVYPQVTNDTIMQFKVSGTYDSLIMDVIEPHVRGSSALVRINTPVKGGRLSSLTLVSGQSALNVVTPAAGSLRVTSTFQRPPLPGVLFSGASYTVYNGSTPMVLVYYTSPPVPGPNYVPPKVIPAVVYVLPTTIHIRSTGDTSTFSCSTATTNPITVLNMFLCSARASNSDKICTSSTSKVGWTRVSDCVRDKSYTYCTATETCGSCYGVCPQSHDMCHPVASTASSETFTCSASGPTNQTLDPLTFGATAPERQVTPVDTSQDEWWWTVVMIVIVILAIMVIIAYIYSRPTVETREYTYPPPYDYY